MREPRTFKHAADAADALIKQWRPVDPLTRLPGAFVGPYRLLGYWERGRLYAAVVDRNEREWARVRISSV